MRAAGSFSAFLAGFVHAVRGLRVASRQRNFRVELATAGVILVAGWRLQVSATEWALLVLCIFWVLGMEALNTAVETLADRVSRERDPLIGQAKDIAAGGVLLAACGAAVIGLIVFLPYLTTLAWG